MENAVASIKVLDALEIEIGLKKAGFRTLGGWCRQRRENYNTAYAALRGLRKGPKSQALLRKLRRDANV